MIRYFILPFIFSLSFLKAFSQSAPFGSLVNSKPVWSLLENPAGIATSSGFEAGTSCRAPLMLKQLATLYSGVVFPALAGCFSGIGFSREGYTMFSKDRIGCSVARNLNQKFSLGVRLDYRSIRQGEDYGSASRWSGTIGVRALVGQKCVVGSFIENPQFLGGSNDLFPSRIAAGLSWMLGKHGLLSVSSEKTNDRPLHNSIAIDYNPTEKFGLHVAASNGFSPFSMGFSFSHGKARICLNSDYHLVMGFSPAVYISYSPAK